MAGRKNTEADFWAKVEVGRSDECWNWTAAPSSSGYGAFRFHGQMVGSHRKAYEFSNGDVPEGLEVLHTCDNRLCCNPRHLFVGTQGDNVRDMQAKGRIARGETQHRAKLTEDRVREIRARFASGQANQPQLAEEFGIIQATVSQIVRRRTWKHVG